MLEFCVCAVVLWWLWSNGCIVTMAVICNCKVHCNLDIMRITEFAKIIIMLVNIHSMWYWSKICHVSLSPNFQVTYNTQCGTNIWIMQLLQYFFFFGVAVMGIIFLCGIIMIQCLHSISIIWTKELKIFILHLASCCVYHWQYILQSQLLFFSPHNGCLLKHYYVTCLDHLAIRHLWTIKCVTDHY